MISGGISNIKAVSSHNMHMEEYLSACMYSIKVLNSVKLKSTDYIDGYQDNLFCDYLTGFR